MKDLEKQSNAFPKPDVVEVLSKDELTDEQKEQLKIVKYKIQVMIISFLQKELFSNHHNSESASKNFRDWICENSNNLFRIISDTGEKIIRTLAQPEDFVEEKVTKEILDEILENNKMKTELDKLKAGFNFDNFDYSNMENTVSAERPEWGNKWQKGL